MRQRGEQYVAEAGCSTPTVHDTPHSGQPAVTASALAFARRIRRQLLERHTAEQNTAVAFADGINGSPHPRHNRGPSWSSAAATSRSRTAPSLPMRTPYDWEFGTPATGMRQMPLPRPPRPNKQQVAVTFAFGITGASVEVNPRRV
ncbi:hypothetical protein [Streptomyces sp. NPDC059378]|uniref:hypothetical protein n=1 Tax=Streptomyces sp. NPDC059378 TaxID=3346815 RepID=UPI0036979744